MTSLICPRCSATLRTESSAVCHASLCSDCGGIWLSASAAKTVDAAFDVLANERARRAEKAAVMPFRDAGGTDPVSCPECHVKCVRHIVAQLEVDHCTAHGTWYDAGELSRVADQLAVTFDRPRPARPVAEDAPRRTEQEEQTSLSRFVTFMTKMRGPEAGPGSGPGDWLTWGSGPKQGSSESWNDYVRRSDRYHDRGSENHSTAFNVADALFDLGDYW